MQQIKAIMLSQSEETAYFSHPTRYYNTETEEVVRTVIETFSPNLICPNRDREKYGLKEESWPYLKTIEQNVKRMYCLEHNGYIGLGQYREIAFALSLAIPVYVIRGNKIVEAFEVELEEIGESDQYAKLIIWDDWHCKIDGFPELSELIS